MPSLIWLLKKSEFEDATTNLNDAKRADAKKAEQVAGATTSLKEATANAEIKRKATCLMFKLPQTKLLMT